jgi:WD40 repeat protein
VVRAGLIPAIRSGVLPGSEGWRVALTRPGDHPIAALDQALTEAVPEVAYRSEDGGDVLGGLDDALGPDEHVLVVVDQFEETFTACADGEERTRFLGVVSNAANDPAGRVTMVLAVRADFYGRCADDPALAELLGANHVLLGPMTADEYRRAIEQPALRVGVHVEPALTEALVAEVLDEPGALPLLSTALLELWGRRDGREIRLEAYIETGGVRGAVSRLAEEVYGGFTTEQRAVARAVLLRLAGTGQGDVLVRRRVPLAEFDAERNEDVARVVGVLTDRRLVTISEGVAEVAHEALLREWPRLRGWIDEDRAGRVLHAHLMETAREWAGTERDPSELYRGARLASALDWTTNHTLELNDLEREFLSASREATEREAERQRRTNRRLRGLLVGVAVFLVVALVAGGLALVQRGRAEGAATIATAQRLGAQAVVEDDLDLSLLLARQAYEISDSVETRSTLLASLLKGPGAIAVLSGTGDRALLIRSSADGSTFAVNDNTGGVAIYDTDALELRTVATFDDQIWFDVSPDGAVIAGSTFEDGPKIGLADTATGETRTVPLPEGADFAAFATATAFRPDGTTFVSLECRPCPDTGEPAFVVVDRDPVDGAELRTQPIDLDFLVDRIEFARGGDLMLYGNSFEGETVVAIRDPETLEEVGRVEPRDGFASAISPDGRTLAVGRRDGSVSLVDIASGEDRVLAGRHNASVQGIGFSPDGTTLLSTADDRDVFVWDVGDGTLREILHGHAGRVAAAPVFDADGSTAFTVGLDSKVIAWDLSGERRLGRSVSFSDSPVGTEDSFMTVASAATSDGSTAISSLGDGSIIALDPATGATRWTADPWSDERVNELLATDPVFPDGITGFVDQIVIAPHDGTAVVSGENREVVAYDLATGEETARWEASRLGWVNGMTFAPDGTLVTANDDGRIVFWDLETQEVQREIRLFDEPADVNAYAGAAIRVAVSTDGTSLAVGIGEPDAGASVAVFDVASGERRWRETTDEFFSTPTWSPDGASVAVGTWQDGSLKVLDAATGRQRGESVTAVAGFVVSVAYTPDGQTIITSGTDGTVKLWDARTLAQLGATLPHEDNEWIDAHLVDGRRLVTLSTGGLVATWELDPRRWAGQACSIASRTLTQREWSLFLPGEPYDPACSAS